MKFPKTIINKTATPDQRRHMDRVAAIGCVCCLLKGHGCKPALIHHIRKGLGKGLRDHSRVIPLCPEHHTDGAPGVAVHKGEKIWEFDEEVLLYVVSGILSKQEKILGQRT